MLCLPQRGANLLGAHREEPVFSFVHVCFGSPGASRASRCCFGWVWSSLAIRKRDKPSTIKAPKMTERTHKVHAHEVFLWPIFPNNLSAHEHFEEKRFPGMFQSWPSGGMPRPDSLSPCLLEVILTSQFQDVILRRMLLASAAIPACPDHSTLHPTKLSNKMSMGCKVGQSMTSWFPQLALQISSGAKI